MKILQLNNLEIGYQDKIIIKNFNLGVDENDLLVILGPSGCGKSTLLYSIAGLLKPNKGNIVFGGKNLFSKEKGINIPSENRDIGFVFQDYSLWPHMTVFDNVAYPLKIRKIKKSDILSKVMKLLDSVDLLDKKDCYPSALSGGEKQRVAIIRAIAINPKLMLLDEPLANIDASLKAQLLSIISHLQVELKIPMIYVTHDQQEAFTIANKMIVMNKGEIIQEGCPRYIYKEPVNEFVAGFVGESNLLEGKKFFNKNHRFAVRPEDIEICETGKYSGKIQKIVYQGNHYGLHLRVNGVCMIINVNSGDYKTNQYIHFNIKRVHCFKL